MADYTGEEIIQLIEKTCPDCGAELTDKTNDWSCKHQCGFFISKARYKEVTGSV